MKKVNHIKTIGVFVTAVLITTIGFIPQAMAYKSQTNKESRVRVEVRPVQLGSEQAATFKVRMNTHSVELNQDMVAISVLKDSQDNEYQPLKWDGSPPSGHHRSGTLVFPPLKGKPDFVILIIRDIANVPERIFEWHVK